VTVPLTDDGQLLHIILHPDWPEQPYMYATAIYLEGETLTQQLVRIRLAEGSEPVIETMVDDLPADQPFQGSSHNGSALAFCGEYLYLSLGDAEQLENVPALDRGEGKILRYRLVGAELERAGIIDLGFPIFAGGFRNPFGMTCDAATGLPLVVDNGPGIKGHDQLRLVEPGSNHGWPYTRDRVFPEPPLWDSQLPALAPTDVISLISDDGAQEVLFSSFNSGGIYRLGLDGAGTAVISIELVFLAPSGALALEMGPDSCLYVADLSSIWRVATDHCQ
jgi:glucose/arabinose dehydrogenase